MRWRAVAVVVMLGTASLVSGCASAVSCPSWAGYDTPADALAAADAVVIGYKGDTVALRDGYNGFHDIRQYTIVVESWVKGSGPDHIDVASAPSGCTDSPYAAGDDFDAFTGTESAGEPDPILLFLRADGNAWAGILPGQQAIAPLDGGIPAAWPTP